MIKKTKADTLRKLHIKIIEIRKDEVGKGQNDNLNALHSVYKDI